MVSRSWFPYGLNTFLNVTNISILASNEMEIAETASI